MRILLINPNTTPSITETVAAHARSVAPADVEFLPVTGRFGARYIASRAASAIAGHAALDAYAEHGAGCDAVYLACFGDPGLLALKELAPVPVVGMAEAACLFACLFGRRFSIVTGGERWGPMLEEFVASQGLAGRLASLRTVAPTGGEIARDPETALASLGAACTAAAQEDGADVVILGGAALAGLARRISPRIPVPVLCSVETGALAAIAAARLGVSKAAMGSSAPAPPADSIGLAAELAARLRGSGGS
jgi:Asp/Glu/hydantoin racemase